MDYNNNLEKQRSWTTFSTGSLCENPSLPSCTGLAQSCLRVCACKITCSKEKICSLNDNSGLLNNYILTSLCVSPIEGYVTTEGMDPLSLLFHIFLCQESANCGP